MYLTTAMPNVRSRLRPLLQLAGHPMFIIFYLLHQLGCSLPPETLLLST
jgi:hypothetical protein